MGPLFLQLDLDSHVLSFLCERSQRLGSDIKKLQCHPFFEPIKVFAACFLDLSIHSQDWEKLSEMESPFVPQGED